MNSIKEKIHQLVDEVDDDELIDAIYAMLNEHSQVTVTFTDEQLKRLEVAREQVKNGETISFEEQKRQLETWRTKSK